MMTDWHRIKAAFLRVLELPVDERAVSLIALGEAEPYVADQVRSLLEHHERPYRDYVGSLLEVVAEDLWPSHPTIEWVGRRIAGLEIVRSLGHGGMGSVYLARDSATGTKRAIKLLHAPPGSDASLRRFEMERQGLERLRHPSICAIHEAGLTTEGVPYLVMEHVVGQPIDQALDARCADIEKRLSILVAVCRTVHFANEQGVLHRDLKPANILVREDDSHVLLDFGIAKHLPDDRSGAPSTLTREFRVFTPHYSSPEQLAGDPVSAASDVFSLGVLGYVLVSGRYPEYSPRGTLFAGDVKSGKFAELARRRSTTQEALVTHMRGPLVRILREATSIEPARRTATAEILAQRLQRWVMGRR